MWASTQVPLQVPHPSRLHSHRLHCHYYSIDGLYPARSAPNQAPQGESGFVDSSGPIFSMYMDMADEEDKKMAESWKADAEGILVFVRCLVPCFTSAHHL